MLQFQSYRLCLRCRNPCPLRPTDAPPLRTLPQLLPLAPRPHHPFHPPTHHTDEGTCCIDVQQPPHPARSCSSCSWCALPAAAAPLCRPACSSCRPPPLALPPPTPGAAVHRTPYARTPRARHGPRPRDVNAASPPAPPRPVGGPLSHVAAPCWPVRHMRGLHSPYPHTAHVGPLGRQRRVPAGSHPRAPYRNLLHPFACRPWLIPWLIPRNPVRHAWEGPLCAS